MRSQRPTRKKPPAVRRTGWHPNAGGLSTRLAYTQAQAAGIALEPILKKANITRQQVENPRSLVGVQDQIVFLDLVADALGDDLLGFRLAQAPDLREIGLFYYVLASSGTLLEALQRAERYSSIVNEGISLKCKNGNAFGTSFHYVGVSRHLDQHQIEFWMTALVRICRQLTGLNIRPSRVRLTHRRTWNDELAAFLGRGPRGAAVEGAELTAAKKQAKKARGGVEGGRGDRAVTLTVLEQPASQLDDVGEVEVVPGDAPVVEALEAGVEPAGDVDHRAAGVGVQVPGHERIECEGAQHDAVGHEPVLLGHGEVVVEPGDELDGGGVREARAIGERVLRPGVEGQQHRLADTGQVRSPVCAHAVNSATPAAQGTTPVRKTDCAARSHCPPRGSVRSVLLEDPVPGQEADGAAHGLLPVGVAEAVGGDSLEVIVHSLGIVDRAVGEGGRHDLSKIS